MSLSELKVGEKGLITYVEGKDAIKTRLISLGLSEGKTVTLSRQSAAKQTLAVVVGSSVIALRRNEAKTIKISKIND